MENIKNNKHEWYELNAKEREDLVLDLQNKGYNIDDLNNYFDVNTDRAIADFMNSKGYSKRNNIFKKGVKRLEEENSLLLKRQEELLNIINLYEEKEKDQHEQINKMLDIIKEYQEKESNTNNQLVTLINDDKAKNERMLSVIEYYMAQSTKIENNAKAAMAIATTEDIQKEEAIDVTNFTLPIPVKSDDFVDRKTVRVSYRIYNKFNDLCKEKYGTYKQQDLVSLALQMFIDKYK